MSLRGIIVDTVWGWLLKSSISLTGAFSRNDLQTCMIIIREHCYFLNHPKVGRVRSLSLGVSYIKIVAEVRSL